MNNREAIDHVRAWHRGEVHLAEIDPTAMDVVLALAEAQVQRTPP